MSSPRFSHRMNLRLLAFALVGVLLVVVSCSGSTTSTTDTTESAPPNSAVAGPQKGGNLDIAVPVGATRWSPISGDWTTSELQGARAVYDRLMERDSNDQPVPELLSKITTSATFSIWTLTIRPGVSFHDGSALDSSIVKFNLEAQRMAPSTSELLSPISSVEAPDPTTVVVTMSSPWSTFPEVLASRVGTIASPATVLGFNDAPIGTGPFSWKGIDAIGATVLVKNPNYWKKGLPHLDSIRLISVAEANDRVTGVIDGSFAMTSVDEPRQLSRIGDLSNRDSKLTVFEDRNAEKPKVAITFNTGRPPFDRLSARRAVMMATDKSEILKQAFDSQGTIARGMVSDTSPWFTDYGTPQRDVAQAKKEVEEYTKETGVPLTFQLLVPPDTTMARVASLWRVQLAPIGIDVVLVPADNFSITISTLTGQYQSALTLGFDSPHPDTYEPIFRGIPAEQAAISSNISRYVNPVITRAFADARSTNDLGKQVDDYKILQEQVSVDLPSLFLVQLREVVIGSPKLRDVTQWSTGSGSTALGQEGATVSLAQVWIAS